MTVVTGVAAKGDHVTVGKSDNVWMVYDVVAVEGGYATLRRLNERGEKLSTRFEHLSRLIPVGQHTRRTDFTESPQNCQECGLYREVKDRG